MEPYAEFTKLENWDQDGKPYLAEVSRCTWDFMWRYWLIGISTRALASSRERPLSLLEVRYLRDPLDSPYKRLDTDMSGDSGIGRSAAQMFAREGADVTIAYLPEEEEESVCYLHTFRFRSSMLTYQCQTCQRGY